MLSVLLLVSSVDARLAEFRNRDASRNTDSALVPQSVEYTTCNLPRAVEPTDEDKAIVTDNFPHVADPTYHDHYNPRYNCIAWSVGLTNVWINPPLPNGNNGFDNFYVNLHGLVQSDGVAHVDAWATNVPKNTHGSVKCKVGVAEKWTSKLGKGPLITHGRHALAGPLYGAVIRSYKEPDVGRRLLSDEKETVTLSDAAVAMMRRHARSDPWETTVTHQQIAALSGEIDDETKAEFKTEWDEWERQLKENVALCASSNTNDYARAEGFQKLTKLGTKILPLLIDRMFTHKEFWALVPYDRIAGKDLVVPYEFQSEQRRAVQTVEKYVASRNPA